MIKTIIFDLNRVLITYKNIEEEYKKTFGITQKRFWEPVKEFFGDYATGKISLDYVLMNIMEKNKLNRGDILEARRLYEKNLIQMPGTDVLLKSLKKNYLLILAAGDGKESLEIKLKKFSLTSYFNRIYATCYMGRIKTDPNFYKEILNRSKIVPGETVFIDDRKSHIEVAKKLKINVILFENLLKLKKDLKKEFNILF